MSPGNDDSDALRAHLRAMEAEFDLEMRRRGFDPEQAENMALPTTLARLYAEREQIKTQLEGLEGEGDD